MSDPLHEVSQTRQATTSATVIDIGGRRSEEDSGALEITQVAQELMRREGAARVIPLSRHALQEASTGRPLTHASLDAVTQAPELILATHPVADGDENIVMVHAGFSLLFRALIGPTLNEAMNQQNNMGLKVDPLGVDVISYTKAGMEDVTVLREQEGLYLVKEVNDAIGRRYRSIDVVSGAYSMMTEQEVCIDRYTNPNVSLFSLTIKASNYPISDQSKKFHDPNRVALDLSNKMVQHDLSNPNDPKTVFGVMFLALKRRMEAGHKGVTVLSFENMPGNGIITKRLLLDYARHSQLATPQLYDWIDANVQAPNTMVDSITREVTKEDRDLLAQDRGLSDRMMMVAEPFRFLVIEKFDSPICEALKRVMWVRIVDNVDDYEKMKLLALNAPHRGAVAYPGLVAGLTHVHHVMQDEVLNDFFDGYVEESIAPLEGLNIDRSYIKGVKGRFCNTQIQDPLGRIARDGIDKIFDRITRPIEYALHNQKSYGHLLVGFASWVAFLEGKDDEGRQFLDHAGQPVKRNGQAVYDEKGKRVGPLDEKAENAGLRYVVANIRQQWQSTGEIDLSPLIANDAVKNSVFNGLANHPDFVANLTGVVESIFAYGLKETAKVVHAGAPKYPTNSLVNHLLSRENGVVRN